MLLSTVWKVSAGAMLLLAVTVSCVSPADTDEVTVKSSGLRISRRSSSVLPARMMKADEMKEVSTSGRRREGGGKEEGKEERREGRRKEGREGGREEEREGGKEQKRE